MINALNSGARVFMADLEDALSPTWANVVGGQVDRPRRRPPRRSTFDEPRGQGLPAGRANGDAPRPAARLAPRASATCSSTAQPVSAQPVRRRPATSSTTRPSALDARLRARTSTCPSSRATSRRASGTTSSSMPRTPLGIPRGIDPGDRAHRDDPGRLRDGRDPLRAARARRRAQRRPLGLHLQHHQEVPRAARLRPARPRPGDDGRARSCAPTRSSSCATCHRRGAHAIGGMSRLHPEPPRARGRRPTRWPRCARTRSARPATASTAPGSPIPTSSRWRAEVFDRVLGRPAEPEGRACARTSWSAPATCSTCRVPGGRVTEAGVRQNVSVAHPLPRRVAARQRRGGHRQPHGGRGHRRDLAARSSGSGGRHAVRLDDGRPVDGGPLRGRPRRGAGRAGSAATPGRLAEAAELLDGLVLDDDFAEFLTLEAYQRLD